MAAKPRARFEFFGLGLLILGLLVAASLFSHGGSQAPSTGLNILGQPGDWFAGQVFMSLGHAAYILLAAWFVIVLAFFAGRRTWRWAFRLIGWICLIPCSAVAMELARSVSVPPLETYGGAIGAWLRMTLLESLGLREQVMIVGSSLSVCIVLAMDTIIVLAWQNLGKAVWFVNRLTELIFLRRRRAAPEPVLSDSADVENEPDEDQANEPEQKTVDDETEGRQDIPVCHPVTHGVDEVFAEANGESPSVQFSVNRIANSFEEEDEEDYELPPLTLLDEPEPFPYEDHDQQLRDRAALLEKTFGDFNLNVRVVGINTGPVITQYEVALETGLRLHKVTRLADDIALNLKVASVRMVAPIPGKNTVGVEIPNEHRAIVRLKEVILTAGKKAGKMKIPLYLGKDSEGRPLLYDLAEMPHLLIAGRTGTGKSVCLNTIILSTLMTRRPDEVKMLMIDPKRTELSEYAQLPHLMHPVVTDMKKAEAMLSWAVDEMERRYDLLSQAKVRSLDAFNRLNHKEKLRRIQPPEEEEDQIPEMMPNIVIIVDEMADLMMTMKREVEGHIIRLAQKSRAAGIHLVVATQKPTVDVITGLIKSNLPARICFQVSSRSDSRVVLDEMGAEKLLGKGDLLFLQPGTSTVIRAQGTYANDEEITRVVEALECEPEFAEELLQLGSPVADGSGNFHERLRSRDDVYEQAIEIVVREGRGSVSLLQRALGIGYGRAARIIDFMAEDGIVGPYRGSSAREVLVEPEEWEQMKEAGQMVGA